jgi:Caspase domain
VSVEPSAPAERRRALVVANARYDDPALERLTSPAQDAAALTNVLQDPALCGFEVTMLVDSESGDVTEAVEGFLVEAERSDLVLLYFSCHGLKDDGGRLYFAARNTRRNRLRSTAIPAATVNELLLASRSRRKVLLLDCCYGGAFARGMQVKADPAVHTAEQFGGRGLIVLTASDSTQYAFDGDVLEGAATPSKFTSVLVSGLSSGDADVDRDGLVTVDDAYDFVRRRLADEDVPQDPRKWEFDVAGRIVLGRSAAVGTAVPLPPPPVVTTLAPPAPKGGSARILQPIWWASSLGVLVASVAAAWLTGGWLWEIVLDLVEKQEYLPASGNVELGCAVLGAVWGVTYAIVAPPAGWHDRVAWRDPWRPPVAALVDVFRPTGARSLARGLVSAVPINVVLVALTSTGAAALAYERSGSELRDDTFGAVFVVLGLAGLARYLGHELVRARRP